MEFKKVNEKENALFNRKEITGTIEAEVTPNREKVLEILSKQFSVPSENIKIKGIRSKYGSQTFDISAHIYGSREEKDKIEIKKKKESEAEKKLLEASASKEPSETESTEGKSDQPAQEKAEEKAGGDKEEAEEKEIGEPDKEPTNSKEVKSEEAKE